MPYRLGDIPRILYGMPAGIRTPDPRLRRAMLYPAELQTHIVLERVKGIGPSQLAWKARALPLSYTRILIILLETFIGDLDRTRTHDLQRDRLAF